jgi:para-nitrobenzyl esterase
MLDALTPDEATKHTLTFQAAVDVKPAELLRLSRLPTDVLTAALKKVIEGPGAKPTYSPVVDGIVLPGGPWQPGGPAVSAGIPMITGTTRTETTALIGAAHPEYFTLDDAALPKALAGWLPDKDVNRPDKDVNRVVSGFRTLMPSASAADLFFVISTDRRVRQQA